METTLKALADLLVEAVPTVIFFLFIAWFLKRIYFRPMAALFEERRKQTEGVRELAKRAFEEADRKQSEFEKAIDLARHEIYEEHERRRREWAEEQARAIAEVRAEVDEQIEQAKHQISAEAQRAQSELNERVDNLGTAIVESLLARRAA
ncbi:MAG TPA: ATP synthase F0 subunit B [Bryobacteraceae bacterium]|jgi:F-type H+-transporting ATPase subunit b